MVQKVCEHHEYIQATYSDTAGNCTAFMQCKNCGQLLPPIVNKQPMQRVYLAKGSKYKIEGESILRDALIDENGNYYYEQPMKEGNDIPLLPEAVNKETRPEDIAREIVNHPNLWGMYSIADAIHKLLKFQKEGNDIANRDKQDHSMTMDLIDPEDC